jgi:hypothetical protein
MSLASAIACFNALGVTDLGCLCLGLDGVATRPRNKASFLEGRALRRKDMVGEAVPPSAGCLGARAVAVGALSQGDSQGLCAALGGGRAVAAGRGAAREWFRSWPGCDGPVAVPWSGSPGVGMRSVPRSVPY